MERTGKRISAHELFPFVKELLAENRQAVFTITGYSMLPFLGNRRDQVQLESCDNEHLKVGDVILFQEHPPSGKYMLHRIYKVTEHGYLTMGDGNTFMDPPIDSNQVIGIVTKVFRKNREIECSGWRWKIASGVWRCLKPGRRVLLWGYRRGSGMKNLIRNFRK